MERWNNPAYQRIKEVTVRENDLNVIFQNGDSVSVSKEAVCPTGSEDVKWDELSFNPFEIGVPATPKNIEILWDSIRLLTDIEFSQFLASKAEDEAKKVGQRVKALRERKGIKANDLAEKAGLTPQTISRIENGHTDVGFATLKKILTVMGYSLKDLANEEEVTAEKAKSTKSFHYLIKKLSRTGIDAHLLTNRIIPKNLQEDLTGYRDQEPELLLNEAASYISNIYGWSLNDIWSNRDLVISNKPSITAYYKKPSNANLNQIKAYSHYAYYLAQLLANNYRKPPKFEYPGDSNEFKTTLTRYYRELDFSSILSYAWDLGICVLPLNDPGVFHGASWNIQGKHVIVLKQKNTSHARWLFDLLHELYHVFDHLQEENTSVIETEEMSPFSEIDSIEEREANAFANEILLNGKAEDYAQECIREANWKIELLKNAIPKVAKKEGVREDVLANYLAFRLSYQQENWWATANKFQVNEPNPYTVATEFLKERIALNRLNPIDYNLLTTAINA